MSQQVSASEIEFYKPTNDSKTAIATRTLGNEVYEIELEVERLCQSEDTAESLSKRLRKIALEKYQALALVLAINEEWAGYKPFQFPNDGCLVFRVTHLCPVYVEWHWVNVTESKTSRIGFNDWQLCLQWIDVVKNTLSQSGKEIIRRHYLQDRAIANKKRQLPRQAINAFMESIPTDTFKGAQDRLIRQSITLPFSVLNG